MFDKEIHTIQPTEENWARELATLSAPAVASINFHLGDIGDSRINRVEVVMFNCPWWGIGIETIAINYPVRLEVLGGETVATAHPTIASCESLVKVCIPCTECDTARQLIGMDFRTLSGSSWVHLAEVIVYFDDNTSTICPQDSLITSSESVISFCNITMQGILNKCMVKDLPRRGQPPYKCPSSRRLMHAYPPLFESSTGMQLYKFFRPQILKLLPLTNPASFPKLSNHHVHQLQQWPQLLALSSQRQWPQR